MLNYSLEPSKAQITLRIEDIQQFEKWGFQNIFDDPSFFYSLYSRKKNMIEKKSRKHAKLWSKKIEEILNSIAVPLTAQPTLRINKKIDFEKWDFWAYFRWSTFFFKLTMFERKKTTEKKSRKHAKLVTKRHRRS